MSKVGSSSSSSTANRARTSRVENKEPQKTTTDAKSVSQPQKAETVEKKPASVDDVRASRTRANAADQARKAELMQKLDTQASRGSVQAEEKLKDMGADVVNKSTPLTKENQQKLDVDALKQAEMADKNPGTGKDLTTGQATANAVEKANETYGANPEPMSQAETQKLADLSRANVYTSADPKIMESVKAGGPGALTRGHKGAGVTDTQASLNKLGFGLKEDGLLGPRTEGAVKQFQKAAGLPETGQVDAATHKALQDAKPEDFKGKITPQDLPPGPTAITNAKMPTGDREQMIRDAILNDPKIPDSWASDPNKMAAINRIVEKESGWRVGIPNYTIRNAGMTGDQAARLLQTNKNLTKFGASSSAMGLFQLLGTNMDKYQPGGRTTIGNAQAEMQGGLRYMMDRYGDPQRALAFHNANNWW
jgi:hypothetical protein